MADLANLQLGTTNSPLNTWLFRLGKLFIAMLFPIVAAIGSALFFGLLSSNSSSRGGSVAIGLLAGTALFIFVVGPFLSLWAVEPKNAKRLLFAVILVPIIQLTILWLYLDYSEILH